MNDIRPVAAVNGEELWTLVAQARHLDEQVRSLCLAAQDSTVFHPTPQEANTADEVIRASLLGEVVMRLKQIAGRVHAVMDDPDWNPHERYRTLAPDPVSVP